MLSHVWLILMTAAILVVALIADSYIGVSSFLGAKKAA